MAIGRLYQGKINTDSSENEKLDTSERLANLEHDMVMNYSALAKIEHFVDARIEKEEESAKFWREIRQDLIKAGFITGVGIFFTALGYGIKEMLHK